jgi:hypothetical protein
VHVRLYSLKTLLTQIESYCIVLLGVGLVFIILEGIMNIETLLVYNKQDCSNLKLHQRYYDSRTYNSATVPSRRLISP